jgi:hypothetical protein
VETVLLKKIILCGIILLSLVLIIQWYRAL